MKVISIDTTEVVDVAVDLGNAVIKGAVKDGNVFKCDKLDNKVQTIRTGNPKEIRFSQGQGELVFGTGKLQNNKLKHEREFLLEQALIMTNKLIDKDSIKVNLRVALPPGEFFNDEYVEKYKSRFPVGVHKFNIEKEPKEVEITNIDVFMEGYSAFLDIAHNIKTTNNLLIFDIGGGTLDCIEIIYDRRDKSFVPSNAASVRKGSIDLYACIMNEINAKGKTVKLEGIESHIDDGSDMINGRYSIQEHLNIAKAEFKSMLNEIANKLECTLSEYDIVCVGGGTTIFKMLYEDSNLIELDIKDTIYSNTIGMLNQ